MSARSTPGPTARNDHVSWLAPPERRTRLAIFWAPATHRWMQAVRPAENGSWSMPAEGCMARVVRCWSLEHAKCALLALEFKGARPNRSELTPSTMDDPIGQFHPRVAHDDRCQRHNHARRHSAVARARARHQDGAGL